MKNQNTGEMSEESKSNLETQKPELTDVIATVSRAKTAPTRAHTGKGMVSQENVGTFKRRLSDILHDGDLEEAVNTIREGMKANKTHWDGVAKRMVTEPDFRIRLEAGKTVLAYKEGMPVQRQVVMQESFESLRDAIMAADHSDEARKIIDAGLLGLENGTAPHRNL